MIIICWQRPGWKYSYSYSYSHDSDDVPEPGRDLFNLNTLEVILRNGASELSMDWSVDLEVSEDWSVDLEVSESWSPAKL